MSKRTAKKQSGRAAKRVKVVTPPSPSACLRLLEPGRGRDPFFGNSDESVMVAIFDLLHAEYLEVGTGRGFFNNRASLLRAFVARQLYIVNDPSVDNPTSPNSPFSRGKAMGREIPKPRTLAPFLGFDDIPAIVVHDPADPVKTILWVHPTYRGLGYGRLMIDERKLTEVWAVEESFAFWEHFGFKFAGRANELDGTKMIRQLPVEEEI